MNEIPTSQHALCYLTKLWRKEYPGDTPPIELAENVVRLVLNFGYNEAMIKRALDRWRDRQVLKDAQIGKP